MITRLLAKIFVTVSLAVLLASCSSQPRVYSSLDSATDLRSFKTYGFYPDLATDKEGYSTLSTQYFKKAITREMGALGYVYTDTNPDLLVNFDMVIEQRSSVESMGPTFGFYGHTRGVYADWPFYDADVRTIHYKVATLSVELIEADKKQSVWEASIEGRMSKEALEDSEAAISRAVLEMFRKHPLQPQPAAE